jgi:CHAT domain-containing protein
LTPGREDGPVRLSISGSGSEVVLAVAAGTLFHKASARYDEARVASASRQLVECLARAARQRTLGQAGLADLRTLGEELYRALFPPAIRDDLSEVEGRPLVLEMDERFVSVPWELVYDGHAFMCRRFDLGRAVFTPQPRRAGPTRKIARPASLLVLCSDPAGDLPAVAAEGEAIVTALESHKGVSVRMASGKDVETVRAWMKDHDLLHYAGHADHVKDDPSQSGWRLEGGKLTARDVADLAGGRPMPLIVFSNACASSHEGRWDADDPGRVFGLANAFLLAGVKYYIGTQWEVVDANSKVFARAFYTELGRGRSVGGAVRRAREAVIVAEGEASLGWASYVLYGDPVYAPLSGDDAGADEPTLPTPAEIASRESIKGVVKRIQRPSLPAVRSAPPPAAPARAAPPRADFPWVVIAVVAAVVAIAAAVFTVLR